jgi:predicted O-methyltransferase YrrM
MSSLPIDTVLSMIDEIPERMCGHPQPLYLYQLSRSLQGIGEVVEIGTCAGKSTVALAFGQKEKSGRKVWTIDIAEHPSFRSNLEKTQVGDWVTPIISRSSLVAQSWDKPVELLWIDGDHRRNAIVTDIKCWSRFVVEGGFMAFHDYPGADVMNETHRALYTYLFSKPGAWRIVSDREAGSIIVFQRLSGIKNKKSPREMFRVFLGSQFKNLRWYLEELRPRV